MSRPDFELEKRERHASVEAIVFVDEPQDKRVIFGTEEISRYLANRYNQSVVTLFSKKELPKGILNLIPKEEWNPKIIVERRENGFTINHPVVFVNWTYLPEKFAINC